MNTTQTNVGGFKSSRMCAWLNTRVYNAFSPQIKALLKQVKIPSTAGGTSLAIEYADCYVSIPSYIEMVPVTGEALIGEGDTIPYMTTNEIRRRGCISAIVDNANYYKTYWYRSPYAGNRTYFYDFNSWYNSYNGTYSYNNGATSQANSWLSVLIMLSF